LKSSFDVSKIDGVTLVTGGAGFIGSHLVDRLVSNDLEVKVIDNLSNGKLDNLKNSKENKKFHFENKDLNDFSSLKDSLQDVKFVFHMAANPEVRIGYKNPEISFRENIQNTFHLLETIRNSNVETIAFGSTSTIYGEPTILPTPEDYGPLLPISPYGASKLACEAMISSYCNTYGIKGIIFRLANIVGSRSNHGVIIDFINKLKENNKELEVLGDGKQYKSYLHVRDCVEGFFVGISNLKKTVEILNVGNDDQIIVMDIAKIVCDSMNLKDVQIKPNGGVEDGRGWIGDVKLMLLDITKLKKLGWAPELSSPKAMELAAKEILKEN